MHDNGLGNNGGVRKSVEQQMLDNAYADFNAKMQDFYDACKKQIESADRDKRELNQEIDEKDAEIEKLKKEKKAKDVLSGIGRQLADLFNAINDLADNESKKELLRRVGDLRTAFRNVGILTIYDYGYERSKDEAPNTYEMISIMPTNDSSLIGKTKVERVGFYINNKPEITMQYSVYKSDGQNAAGRPQFNSGFSAVKPAGATARRVESVYPFMQGVDFRLFDYKGRINYFLTICSTKMKEVFKDLPQDEGYIMLNTKYKCDVPIFFTDPLSGEKSIRMAYALQIEGCLLVLYLYDKKGNYAKVALATVR